MKMETEKRNGSMLPQELQDFVDSDHETSGKIKVLVHQDAFDVPEDLPKRTNGGGERHYLMSDIKPVDFHTKIVEPDDVITPLSEESGSTATGHIFDDKPVVETDDSEANSCLQSIFPCWGTIIDPSTMSIARFFGVVMCFVFYVGNIASDIAVCYHLFFHGNWLWFSLVAAFTVIPTVILNCVSYHLSVSKRIVKRNIWNQEEWWFVSGVIALLHLSQFGVFARYLGYIFLHELEYLWVVFCPSSKRIGFNHHNGRCVELPYIPYLFIVEAVLQCFPQLVLQLYIFIVGHSILATDINQMLIISIIVSVLNLSRLLTLCKHLEKDCSISWCGLILTFLWFLFTNISRVLSFTLFLTKFMLAFAMLCMCHWIIMSVWAVSVLTPSVPCKNWKGLYKNIKKYAKGLVFGLQYILCFLRLKIEDDSDEPCIPTRYLYAFFYSVIFLENSVLAILWYVYNANVSYAIPVVATVFVSFPMGMCCMYLYYRYYHKNVVKHSDRWKCMFLFPRKQRV